MGRVFEAVDINLHRKVAIKIIRGGLPSEEAARKFIDESRTLARFAHPGIAQIFTAGDYHEPGADRQIPYFAMEYVSNAVSITRYAQRHGLSTHEKVRLLMRVCEALEHAHRCRVLHRDLKPSNIIISDCPSESGEFHLPQPKVIDFGIARPIDVDGRAQPAAALVGTLEYMAPEQCEGRALDGRTDVYALGVILYELLAGGLPYPVMGCSTTQEAVEVIAKEPPRALGKVNRALKGDLEAIVGKALAKAPEERYQSAARFRADLDRYLAGEAVEARSGSLRYVIGHRVRARVGAHPVAAMATLVLMVVMAVLIWGIPLIFKDTNLHLYYGQVREGLLGSPTLGTRPDHSVLIAVTDDTDVGAINELIHRKDLVLDRNDKMYLFRAAYAHLIDSLSETQLAALVFDTRFNNPPEGASESEIKERTAVSESLSAAAARFKQKRGMSVIAAANVMSGGLDIDLPPPVSPVESIAREMRMRSAGITMAPGNLVGHFLVGNPRSNIGYPAIMLDAYAVASRSTAAAGAALSDRVGIDAGRVFTDPELSNEELKCVPKDGSAYVSLSEMITVGDNEYGVKESIPEGLIDGDRVGVYCVEIPGEEYFQAATINLSDAMKMPGEKLAELVRGKVVVAADLRTKCKDHHDLCDDRHIPGAYTQVAAIESMFRGVHIRMLNSERVWVCTILASILGCLIVWWLARRALALVAAMLTAGGVIFAGCLLIYLTTQQILDPFIPIFAMLISGACCWGIIRLNRGTRKARFNIA